MQAQEQHWNNIALYCRVSKEEQSVEQQVELMQRWLGPRAVKFTTFVEKKSSRKIRPVKEAMMERVRAGEFDAVAVWKIDRFARDAEELLSWRNEASKIGFAILSYSEQMDTSTSSGRFMFTIMAAFAELERDMISDRTKTKRAYNEKMGLPTGGKQRVYYDEELAVRLAPTVTVRALADVLGVSKTTAERIKKRLGNRGAEPS